MSDKGLSRRDLLTFWRRGPTEPQVELPPPPQVEPTPPPIRAKLIWNTCIAYYNTPCDACHQVCPVDQAIQIDNHGHPRLDRYLCNGCGDCLKVCPTQPSSLIMAPLL